MGKAISAILKTKARQNAGPLWFWVDYGCLLCRHLFRFAFLAH